MENLIKIESAEMLSAINRSEVDMQIATAKQYPRDISHVLDVVRTFATMDSDTASECFYVLRRNGNYGESNNIEGLSVRMAEIIASAWGNMRVQTRIIGNDGKTITAQGVCHDLESNLAVSVEVKRRITDKFGKTYSEDMQVVTGNAASAIAFRNAVLKVVPKALTKKIIEDVKQVAIGKAIDLETSRTNCIASFAKIGISRENLFSYLGIESLEGMTTAIVMEARGLFNAIKEGDTSVQEILDEIGAKGKEDAAKQTAQAIMDKVTNSMKGKKEATPAPEPKEMKESKAEHKTEQKAEPKEELKPYPNPAMPNNSLF